MRLPASFSLSFPLLRRWPLLGLAALLLLSAFALLTGPPAAEAQADTTAPTFESASVDGAALVVVFNENLDTGSVPAAAQLGVRATVGSTFRTILGTGTVGISGKTMTVALASPVASTETVLLAYIVPQSSDPTAGSPLQDAAGNQVQPILFNQAVTNNTPPPSYVRLVENTNVACAGSVCPDAPSGHAGPGANAGEITVHWRPATTGDTATGWRVYLEPLGVGGGSSRDKAAADRSHTFTGLDVTKAYFIRVQGFTTSGVDQIFGRASDATDVRPFDPPTVSSAAVNTTALTITFNKDLAASANLENSAFTVKVGGSAVSLSTTRGPSISGRTVTLTLASAVARTDTVTVSYTQPTSGTDNALRDAIGRVASFSDQAVTNVTRPTFVSALVNGTAMVITFSENLAASSTPAGSAFTVSVTPAYGPARTIAGSTATINAVTRQQVAVALSGAVLLGETVTVSYVKPTSNPLNASGREVANFSGQAVDNNTPPPQVNLPDWGGCNGGNCVHAPSTTASPGPGHGQITLNWTPAATGAAATSWRVGARAFGETDQSATLGAAARTHTFSGLDATKIWVITLRGVAGSTDGRLRRANVRPAARPAFSGASVSGTSLAITFSKPLHGAASLANTSFQVKANGSSVGLSTTTGPSISGKTATITLASAVAFSDTVTVSYTQPTSGANHALKDVIGKVASFTDRAVTNNTPPLFVSAEMEQTTADMTLKDRTKRIGTTLIVTFSKELATGSGTAGSAFTVTVAPPGGPARTISGTSTARTGDLRPVTNQRPILVPNRVVEVTLGGPVLQGETVTVAYTRPPQNPLKDTAGNEVETFSGQPVANYIPLPMATRATLARDDQDSRNQLTLTFDQTLDAGSAPAGSAFTVVATWDDWSRTVAGTGNARISGSTATVTLARGIVEPAAITVFYDKPTQNPLQDALGNEVPSFTLGEGSKGTRLVCSDVGHWAIAGDLAPNPRSGSSIPCDMAKPGWTYHDTKVGHIQFVYTQANPPPPVNQPVADGTNFPAFTYIADANHRAVRGADGNYYREERVNGRWQRSISYGADADAGRNASWNAHNRWRGLPMVNPDGGTFPSGPAPVPPVFESAAVDVKTLTMTFTENLNRDSVPAPGAFRVTVNDARRNVADDGVAISGKRVTLTLASAVIYGETVKVGYTRPSARPLQSTSGIVAFTFPYQTVTNNTPPPPMFSSGAVSFVPTPVQFAHTQLVVDFDKDIDATSLPAASTFRVTATPPGGSPRTVIGDAIAHASIYNPPGPSSRVIVRLAGPVQAGETLTVSYAKPATGGLQDTDGVAVQSFSGQRVANLEGEEPMFSSGAVSFVPTPAQFAHTQLVVDFDKDIDATSLPAASTFRVTATPPGGSPRTIIGDAIAHASIYNPPGPSSRVIVRLAGPVQAGETLTVSYAKPATGGLQDTDGVAVQSFSGQRVANLEGEEPMFSSGAVSFVPTPVQFAHTQLVVDFDKDIDATSLPAASTFRVTATPPGGSPRTVIGDAIAHASIYNPPGPSSRVIVRLAGPVQAGETLTVSYAKPATGGLQDTDGVAVQSFSGQRVANLEGEEPMFSSGAVSFVPTPAQFAHTQLVVDFDKDIDATSLPAASTFRVTATPPGGSPRTIIGDAIAHASIYNPPGPSSRVIVRLAGPVQAGETLTVSYAKPATGGLQDTDGVAVQSFSGQRVANLEGEATFTPGASGDSGSSAPLPAPSAQPIEPTAPVAAPSTHADPGPAVTAVEVTSDPGDDDTYGLGDTIHVRVTFDEPVDVTGTPRLKIDMDPAEWGEKWAAYQTGSGTSSLTFAHTVVEPNISTQGIAVLANTLELNGGTIRSGGNDADLAHTGQPHDANHKVDWQTEPESGGGGGGPTGTSEPPGGASGDSGSQQEQNSPASVSGVSVSSSPQADATYGLGETISITLTFSETVAVTGAPRLKIDLDPADGGEQWAAYASGSSTPTLTFAHTVAEPNISTQGIAVLADTLELNGGTIQASGVDADLSHTSLAHNANHKVDWQANRPPVFHGVAEKLDNALPGFLVSLPMFKTDFRDPDGDPLTFTLSASRDDVYGSDGDMPGIVHNERVGRVFFLAKSACALAALDPPTGEAYYTVITMTAADPDGATAHTTATFRTDPAAFVCPSFSSATVDGATLTMLFDADLSPSYTEPTAGEFVVKADGAAVSLADTGAVSISGDTISLTLAAPVSAGQTVTVSYAPGDFPVVAAFTDQPAANDTAAPAVTGVEITSDAGDDDTYGMNDVISIRVTFSEAVDVNGSPRIKIKMDPNYGEKWAAYEGGSGTASLTFTHTVVEPNISTQGIAVLENSLELNGGTIQGDGLAALLAHTGLGHDSEHKVDWQLAQESDTSSEEGGASGQGGDQSQESTPASVSGVNVSSSPQANATYGLGETISITLTFSEAVDVTGSPRLKIDMDPAEWGEKWAAYQGGSGTATLTFTHTVAEPNISTQGIALLADTLELNGGTIQASGVDADLSHTALGHNASHKVDWRLPAASVTGVEITSDPGGDDTYASDDVITITLTFSKTVNVTGSPRLKIDMDPAEWGEKWAAYQGGSGTATLAFTHTVVEPNISTQGIAVLENSLELNGGTMQSDGLAALLAHTGLGHDPEHKVDWQLSEEGGAGS